MYIIQEQGKIILADEDLQRLEDTLKLIPQYDKRNIEEVSEASIVNAYDGNMYLAGYAPQKPLDELKSEKRAEINQARDAAEQGGFEYMGKIFDSDPISCQRISCAAQAMSLVQVEEGQPEPTITWTCQDNSTIDLNPVELLGLVGALAQWSNSCHEKATALKAQIDAATTNAEVEAVKWN